MTVIYPTTLLFGVLPDIAAPGGWKKIEATDEFLMIESPRGDRYYAHAKDGKIIRRERCRIATREDEARTDGRLKEGTPFMDDTDVVTFS